MLCFPTAPKSFPSAAAKALSEETSQHSDSHLTAKKGLGFGEKEPALLAQDNGRSKLGT